MQLFKFVNWSICEFVVSFFYVMNRLFSFQNRWAKKTRPIRDRGFCCKRAQTFLQNFRAKIIFKWYETWTYDIHEEGTSIFTIFDPS